MTFLAYCCKLDTDQTDLQTKNLLTKYNFQITICGYTA